MRKLTEQEIVQLFTFTKKHLVEHYDVQVELVDHLANAIEAQWTENPNISFEDALQKEYKNFGIFGFSGLVEQKQAALQNHYWKLIKKEMIGFFSIPKVILTAALVYVLFHFYSNPSDLNEQLFLGLSFTLLLVTFVVWMFQYRKFKKSKNKYLIQSISNSFYSIPCTLIVFFSSNFSTKPSLFTIVLDTSTTTLYILFVSILFTKIIPFIKREVIQTELKYSKL